MGVLGINHIAFRSPDAAGLRSFYVDLLGAEPLSGAHDPIRVGSVVLVFFSSELGGAGPDPDEVAFEVDSHGFEEVQARAHRMGISVRGPLAQTPYSRGFYVSDLDGRRVEITHEDLGVFWKED
jgi:catechol 2,3-dioxygenase-like lactoylglutathione lyase family enzyme